MESNLKKTNLEIFAEQELARIKKDEDGMQKMMNEHILKIVRLFADEGHSGFSANYAINVLTMLLRYLPLTAIEDNPEDWNKCSDDMYQHKRCGHIFKNKDHFDGQAYNSEGRVFSSDNGQTWFINSKSRVTIEFPYHVPLYPEKYLVDENGNIIP